MNLKCPIRLQSLPPEAYKFASKSFAPGQEAMEGEYEPGDFILTHGDTCVSRIIRFGQGLRFWGRKRKYTWWNHAALIVSQEGNLIEAIGHGVVRSPITKYAAAEYTVVRVHHDLANTADRDEVVRYAEWSLGQKYGFLTIISIALNLIFG